LATYLLFLAVLFSCFGIVSVFMTNSQIDMSMERSIAEYKRIAVSLARDIAVLHTISHNLPDDLDALLSSYMDHYAQADVTLELVSEFGMTGERSGDAAIYASLENEGGRQSIAVSGYLPEPFGFLRLDYALDMTELMEALAFIQRILLIVCIGFAILTAFILFFILTRIFKPLALVSQASRKIATGNYSGRVTVHGKSELAAMAEDFNRMADQIERQVQELIDDSEGKQLFIDNIAHELRTPLTSIFGYAEYMQKIALDDPEMIESMQYIMDEASYMQNMSDSLLTLATLRGYNARKEEILVPNLFDDICQSLSRLPGSERFQIVSRPEIEVVYGQEDLIKSLLLNLCTNAIKACSQEELKMGVVSLGAKKSGDTAVLSVTDNGCGIPIESLPKITDPFYRVDKARSRENGGAGLGLALCKRIADAHGASLDIVSTPDIGTKVEITFYNTATTPQ